MTRDLIILNIVPKIVDNKTADADELKTHLIDEWAQFDQSIVDAAISQWRRRLIKRSVRVRGTLFEHIKSDHFEANYYISL